MNSNGQAQTSVASAPDFRVQISARFLKDPAVSPTAKLFLAILRAYADTRTGVSYVTAATLQKLLRCSRGKREAAQREMVESGWLKLAWLRGQRGKWARRVFVVAEPTSPPLLVFTAAVKSSNKYSVPKVRLGQVINTQKL